MKARAFELKELLCSLNFNLHSTICKSFRSDIWMLWPILTETFETLLASGLVGIYWILDSASTVDQDKMYGLLH